MTADLSLKHSCGKLLIKDDPVLLRLTVKTELEATEELKAQVKAIYPGYTVTYERLERRP